MKTDTSTFLAQQIVRLRRRDQIRRLMQRDKTPLAILFMAAVVGTLTGLVGVAFEKTVSWVQNMRIGALVQVADHAFLLWPLAFILSALLAMVGYFLVRKFAPEAGGSGIPEIEGALEELRPVRWWRAFAGEVYRRDGNVGRRNGIRARRANGANRGQPGAHGAGCFSYAQRRSAAYVAGDRRGGGALCGV